VWEGSGTGHFWADQVRRTFNCLSTRKSVNFSTIVPQIEYGDFYKFIVSIGIALMIAAVLLPWLFLREPFDLLLDSNQLARLTPSAQAIIIERQHFLARIIHLVPWFSGVLLVAGVSLATVGLSKWHRRQILRDRSEELGVKKQELELTAMSPDEVNAKLEADAEQEQQPQLPPQELVSSTNRILNVEIALRERLIACLGNSHSVLSNQRLGSAQFDLILSSRSSGQPDVIIEIKYIRQGFGEGWLREIVGRLVLSNELYKQHLRRDALPLLIIIPSESAQLSKADFSRMRQRLPKSIMQPDGSCRVELLPEANIDSISCDDLKKLIFG